MAHSRGKHTPAYIWSTDTTYHLMHDVVAAYRHHKIELTSPTKTRYIS